MKKLRLRHFEESDILHLAISDEPEAGSIEIGPNVTAELNAKGELIGNEITRAGAFLRDMLLDTVQGRMLNLRDADSDRGN
jgi:uncharacterized protein YuzE